MSAKSPTKIPGPAAPRRLGDAWRHWDAARDGLAVEYRDGPALCLLLQTALAVLLAAACAFAIWVAEPRLGAVGLDGGALRWMRAAVAAVVLAPVFSLWAVAGGWRPRGAVARGLRAVALSGYPPASLLGRALRISPDRLGHSFLELANRLASRASGAAARGLLLLAPRCLRADQMRELRALAAAAGVEFTVVGGGEEARATIAEIDPAGVLAIACERDLVTGVREIAPARPVLTLANRRPEGPCRNSEIDLDRARALLDELQALVDPRP
jgi:uncharacterized protein